MVNRFLSSPWDRGARGLVAAPLCAIAASSCLVDERPLRPLQVVFIQGGEAGASPSAGEGGSPEAAGGSSSGGTTAGGEAGMLASGGTNGGGAGPVAGSSGTGNQAGSSANGASSGAGGTSVLQGGTCGCASQGSGAASAGCPDLDGNGIPDCDESLAANPSFDADSMLQAWTADTNVELKWITADAHTKADSGSLVVENDAQGDQDGSSMLGARQCFRVVGGAIYHFGSEISVPDAAGQGRGGLQVTVYDVPGCVGSILDTFNSNLVKGSTWKASQVTYISPATAKSLLVRLVAVKLFRDPSLAVGFDNVLVRTE